MTNICKYDFQALDEENYELTIEVRGDNSNIARLYSQGRKLANTKFRNEQEKKVDELLTKGDFSIAENSKRHVDKQYYPRFLVGLQPQIKEIEKDLFDDEYQIQLRNNQKIKDFYYVLEKETWVAYVIVTGHYAKRIRMKEYDIN